jgi:hypothetical protein
MSDRASKMLEQAIREEQEAKEAEADGRVLYARNLREDADRHLRMAIIMERNDSKETK